MVQISYYHQILILLIFSPYYGKIWACRLSFFKTLLIFKVNHLWGFYLFEDYLRHICSKFHASVTPQSRVITLFFKRDYSAHPPSSSVTLMSRFKSVTVTPLWNWWWKFRWHDEKEHEILHLHWKFQVLTPWHSAIMKFLMWLVGKLLQNNHASWWIFVVNSLLSAHVCTPSKMLFQKNHEMPISWKPFERDLRFFAWINTILKRLRTELLVHLGHI